MEQITQADLSEALRAVNSIIHKCEKAQEKFPEGNAHHTLLRNRIKAMYISKMLIEERLSETKPVTATEICTPQLLLSHLEHLHTTDLGAQRIQENLRLDTGDVVAWCREQIKASNSSITRQGKNWYITVNDNVITVNAQSYTIITAHKKKIDGKR